MKNDVIIESRGLGDVFMFDIFCYISDKDLISDNVYDLCFNGENIIPDRVNRVVRKFVSKNNLEISHKYDSQSDDMSSIWKLTKKECV